MFTGLHSEMRQTTQEFVRFSRPPIPRSQIPNPESSYAVWQKDRTSNVAPWRDRTSSVRCRYPGKGGRVGKEGSKKPGAHGLAN